MERERRILVTGAGGFIGHQLVTYLVRQGHWVRGADTKFPAYEPTTANAFIIADLRKREDCAKVTASVQDVYHLAADTGGSAYKAGSSSHILHNNLLIDNHMIGAARANGVARFLYVSSADVYPKDLTHAAREEEARPETASGWAKMTGETLCHAFWTDHGFRVRIARLPNVYGPLCEWDVEREGLVASLCRQAAMVKLKGEGVLSIWGAEARTPMRSFLYVDDAIESLHRLIQIDNSHPVNITQRVHQAQQVEGIAKLVCGVAGVDAPINYRAGPPSAPMLVLDPDRMESVLRDGQGAWTPPTSLAEGLVRTYNWFERQVAAEIERGLL